MREPPLDARTRIMRGYMLIALVALLVAASTGVLLRFGLVWGMPDWAKNFSAVRHAHSHLMYFGWGAVALMALIWRQLAGYTPIPRRAQWQMRATAAAALLSFPAFWANGYGLTAIGPVALPLGSMVSGLNGFLWLLFAGLYVGATARLHPRPLPVQLWDWAVVLLLLACGGAVGLVLLTVLDYPSVFLQQTMLHLFLDLFATGWFTLGMLGLLWSRIEQQTALSHRLPNRLPTMSLALCLAPTFFLGLSPVLVPPYLFWISAAANACAALLLGRHLYALWIRRAHFTGLIRFGLLALGVHLVFSLTLLWPGLWRWSAATQLPIFAVHNLLLGWFSSALLGLVLAIRLPHAQRWWLYAGWIGGVGVMLLALLGMGLVGVAPFLPARDWLRLAAWSSLPVAGSIGVAILFAFRTGRPRAAPDSQREQAGAVSTS